MIHDNLLDFVPIGTNLSLVAAAGVSVPSSNVIDILGSGVGTAPMNIIGNVTVFGEDSGIGGNVPNINIVIGTAVTTGDACTLNVAFQGAPDLGAGGGYQPGTWQTFNETGPMTAAQLTAGTVIRLDWFPAFPPNEAPRYLRLLFQGPATLDFTAGTIASAIVTMVRDDWAAKYAAKNFSV